MTARRMDFFRLLARARWLTTSQVHRRFFGHATVDAARKWLRAAVETRHLMAYRTNRMSEILFALGPEGKRVLERSGAGEIRLERTPPKQIEHLGGINDIRIAAELTGALSYFFASWELPGLQWRYPIIPDGVFEIDGNTFAAEFDRGLEAVKIFLRTKITVYEGGLAGLPLTGLIIVADSKTRMETLMRAVAGTRLPILLSTLELVRRHSLDAPVFYRYGADTRARLL